MLVAAPTEFALQGSGVTVTSEGVTCLHFVSEKGVVKVSFENLEGNHHEAARQSMTRLFTELQTHDVLTITELSHDHVAATLKSSATRVTRSHGNSFAPPTLGLLNLKMGKAIRLTLEKYFDRVSETTKEQTGDGSIFGDSFKGIVKLGELVDRAVNHREIVNEVVKYVLEP